MLTSLRIQNFRSIRDASVKLGQVNLFIGPNNSGKSNFLKGIKFGAKNIELHSAETEIDFAWYEQNLYRKAEINSFEPASIQIQFVELLSENKFCEANTAVTGDYRITGGHVTNTELEVTIVDSNSDIREALELNNRLNKINAYPSGYYGLWQRLSKAHLYKIEPAVFKIKDALSSQHLLDSTGSNITNFIHTLAQNHRSLFRQLEMDFASCVGELVSISTPADPDEPGKLKLRFFDKNEVGYWAEEVSEGVLYFLALLCIVHQPDPPKLLLLEEPEKGIHPRRIKEVMDFIFELSQLRGIQIIMTSHSPYVVDHFADIPECISVFDRDLETGETTIRNAGDLITETNERLAAEGKKPIRYSDSLGEHWVSGFLGGVPA